MEPPGVCPPFSFKTDLKFLYSPNSPDTHTLLIRKCVWRAVHVQVHETFMAGHFMCTMDKIYTSSLSRQRGSSPPHPRFQAAQFPVPRATAVPQRQEHPSFKKHLTSGFLLTCPQTASAWRPGLILSILCRLSGCRKALMPGQTTAICGQDCGAVKGRLKEASWGSMSP